MVAQGDRLSPVRHIVLAAAVWIVLTVGSLAIVLRVVLALPVDYFERERTAQTSWTLRRIAENVAGVLLIIAGAVLSIPGVPGQGLLTMLAGLLLRGSSTAQAMERPSCAGRAS